MEPRVATGGPHRITSVPPPLAHPAVCRYIFVYRGGRSDRNGEEVTGTTALTLPAAPPAAAPLDEEDALVARCLAGDNEAFRPLVQRHQRVVFSVAFRMLGSRADAEDIAQQAFVDAFGALDRFRSEGRKNAFATWIIRIAVNRSKDVLKSKKRTEAPLEDDVSGGAAMFAGDLRDPEAQLETARTRSRLEAALLKVPLKYREVLVLKDVEELSYEEIHAILHLPVTTLKIRVVRARAMLRDLLEEKVR
jgi:RNA polymerase sigma-70 factor, ECF subfamily